MNSEKPKVNVDDLWAELNGTTSTATTEPPVQSTPKPKPVALGSLWDTLSAAAEVRTYVHVLCVRTRVFAFV